MEKGIQQLLEPMIERRETKLIIKQHTFPSDKRKKIDYFDQYNNNMIAQVERKCQWELETFEYGFRRFNKNNIVKDISEIKRDFQT